MKKIKGAGWDTVFLTAAKFATTFASLVITKILSTKLSLVGYGTYSQAMMIISIASSVVLMGMPDAINFFFNKKEEEQDAVTREHIVNTIFAVEIVLGVIAGGVILLAQNGIVNYFSNEPLRKLMLLVAFKPMIDNILMLVTNLYVSVGKAKIIAMRNLIFSGVKILIVYVGAALLKDVASIFLLMLLSEGIQLVVLLAWFYASGIRINPFQCHLKYIKPVLAIGVPMGLYLFTNTLTRELDKLVIGFWGGTEQLAIYTNCGKVLPFDIITTAATTVMIPYIVRSVSGKDYDAVNKLYGLYLKIGFITVWLFGTIALSTNESLLLLLYSEEYMYGSTVFVLYILDAMIRFIGMHQILVAFGKSKLLMVYSIASLIINAGLNIALYHWIGFIGPAISTLIVALLYVLAVGKKSLNLIERRFIDVLDWKEFAIIIGCLIGLGIMGRVMHQWLMAMNVAYIVRLILVAGVMGLSFVGINAKRIKCILSDLNHFRI